jgi:autotransporter-associated beta strand protein
VTATAAAEGGQYLTLTIGTGAADLIWTNAAATGTWNHNTDANFNNGGSPDVFKTYDAVTFGNTAAGTVNLAGTLYPGTVTVDSSAGNNYTFSGTGSLGGGTLVKAGDSTLTLNTANTHGGTVVTGGILSVVNAGALGSGSLTFNGGTLNNGTGGALVLANPLVLEGNATLTGPDLSFTGGLTATEASELSVGPNSLTLSGALTSSGGDLITKKGAGTMNLTGAGAGALAGGLQVDAGTLNINAATGASFLTLGTGPDDAVVDIDGNQQGNRLAAIATVLVGGNGTLSIRGVNAVPNHANSANYTVEAGGLFNIVSGASPATNITTNSHHHMGNLTLNGGTLTLTYSGTGIAYNTESSQLNGNVIIGGTTPSLIDFGAGTPSRCRMSPVMRRRIW